MIEEGHYPDSLKVARVTPIHKSGSKTQSNNYRPISILKSLNKIFERLLFLRLNNFVQSNNIMYKHQYGFSENKSTTDACMRVINSIQTGIRENKYALTVFYDFKKAFDTVDHNRLLFKLHKYGIRGPALELFRSYLHNRFQYVSIDDECSELNAIQYGVPQGSILGPLLFNLYINDLHYFLDQSLLTHFADDTTTVSSHVNLFNLYSNVQLCLNTFQNWAQANLLILNTDKTKYLLFSPRSSECIVPYDLQLNGSSLEKINSIRYLGLQIDDKLKYDFHIVNVCSRLSRMVGVSYAINDKLTLEAARSLYFSLAHSIITYLLLFWGSTYDSYIERVQILQNKIIRNLFSQKLLSVNTMDLFYKLNILKVRELFQYELGISMYKAIYLGYYDPLTESLRDLNWSHHYNTRKINSYRVPNVKTSANTRHLIFKGVQLWNSLPFELRTSRSLYTFKNKFKNYLLAKYAPL